MVANNFKIKMIVGVALFVFGSAALVMWLWNWLIPDIFQGPVISYLQALGLLLLSKILFRSPYPFTRNRRKWMNAQARFNKMTPEERERVRALWKTRCRSFEQKEVSQKDSDVSS